MITSLMPVPKQQYFAIAGIPLVGGKVYTYAAGTNTPKATYTNADGSEAQPNPIPLNARGEPAKAIFWSGNYRVEIRDALGNLIYSVDNYNSDPAGLWSLPDQLGVVLEKLNDIVSIKDRMTPAQIADVESGGFSVDVTAVIQAAINSGASRFYAPKGGYSISSLDLRGKYVTIVGDGIGQTIFKCNAAGTAALFNANENSDTRISPLVLQGMTLDANGKAQSCLDIRYRHLVNLENVYFGAATAQNIKLKDTWLLRASQCISEGAPIGMWLVGSNHRNKFDSFSFQGNTIWQVKIEKNGTAADGNLAIEFNGCDLEFGAGGGAYIDASDVAFRSCYIGENIDGPVLQVQSGSVLVEGGTLFFGHTANAFGTLANGGKTLFKKVGISGQLTPGLGTLLSGTAKNAVRYEDCTGNTTIGGGPVIGGDLLDYGPQGVVYAKRLGKSFAAKSLNATITTAVDGNARTVTCASVTGAPPIISLECPLSGNADWRDGEPMYLVMVYEASKGAIVRFSGGSFGVAPTVFLAGAPATTKTTTLVKLDGVMPNGAYNIVEIYNDSVAAGDYIKLYEFFLADSRMLNKGSSSWGNLYKC